MRNIQIPPALLSKLNVPQIQDITDLLPVNPNYTWQELTGGPRKLENLTTLVLHHDAIPKSQSAQFSDIELAKRIATSHINSKKNEPKGDGGFPYHIWVRNGRAYQCNDILTFTYGVSSNNEYTLHACVSGDYYNYDTLTDPDRKALYGVIFAGKSVLPKFKEIKAHRELDSTNCPGYDYNQVRKDIVSIEQQLAYEQSTNHARETAYAVAEENLYLYNLAQGKDPSGKPVSEGTQQWAIESLLKIAAVMRENKLIK